MKEVWVLHGSLVKTEEEMGNIKCGLERCGKMGNFEVGLVNVMSIKTYHSRVKAAAKDELK